MRTRRRTSVYERCTGRVAVARVSRARGVVSTRAWAISVEAGPLTTSATDPSLYSWPRIINDRPGIRGEVIGALSVGALDRGQKVRSVSV